MGSVVGAGLVRETGPGYVFLFARSVIIPHNLLSCAVPKVSEARPWEGRARQRKLSPTRGALPHGRASDTLSA